jgi:pentatricopeptide repeat protein
LVFQEATYGKFSDTLLNSLLEAYGCLNNWRKLNAVLCVMLKMCSSISILGYRFLISRMCEQSRFTSASSLKMLFQHSDKPRELISYNILIFYLFKRRNSSQVHELLKDMKGNGISPDKITYDFLIYGFHKSGDTDSSVNMLDSCLAKGLQPSNRSLRIVLNHHCRLGNLEKSLALFHLIERSGWKHGLTINTTLTSCLLSFGRHFEARSCLNNLSKCAFIGSDFSLDACIKQFCRLGDLQMSVNLMNTMLKKGEFPSEASYSSVIYRLCVLKEFDKALDFFAEMQFTGLKPSYICCDALIRGLCSMVRTCDARKILETLTTLGSIPSYDMYRVIFDNYHRSSNLQKAAAVLHDMQQTGQAPNFEMHWSIISNFSSTGKRPQGHAEPILPNLFSLREAPMKHIKVRCFFNKKM